MRGLKVLILAGAALAASTTAAFAADPPAPVATPAPAPPYGAPIGLELARRIVAASEAEARKHGYLMAFAVVEPDGTLVCFDRMDGVQYGSVEISQEKARTAARFKRASKVFQDGANGGRPSTLSLGVTAVEGGVPIVVDGHIVGAIGASGGSSDQDGAMAAAGLAAISH